MLQSLQLAAMPRWWMIYLLSLACVMLPMAMVVAATPAVMSQSETLAHRAGTALQKGDLSLADAQARDALKQANTVTDKARATIVLAMIQAKNGQPDVAEQLLQKLILVLPSNEPYRNQALKALAVVQATPKSNAPKKITPYNTMTEADYYSYAVTPGQVVHWNLARMPLRVYIEPNASASQMFGNIEVMVINGMNQWRVAEPRLSFIVVKTEKESDIRVRWQKSLEHNRIGESPSFMVGKRLVLSDLVLATHHPNGSPLTKELIGHTIVHEFGHVLGIHGHSPNEGDMMYWQATGKQTKITQRDINTLKRLYATPADYTNDATQSMAASRDQAKNLLIAQQLMEQGSYNEALPQLAPLLRITPPYYDAHILAAVCYSKLGNTSQAIYHYETGLQADASDARAQFNLGLLYIRMGEAMPANSESYKGWHTKALAAFLKAKPVLQGQDAAQADLAIAHCQKVLATPTGSQTASTF
jgi:predicted Zn-dependent protease/Tfp pilus assembly protein PilF